MDDLQPFVALGLARASEPARTPARAADWELRELNHRLANSLQLAVDLLGLQQQRTPDPAARAALDEAMARLAAVGQLHRYLSVREAGETVELDGFLKGLAQVIGLGTGLACEVEAAPLRIPAQTAQNIGLLINECAINARKHAYGADGGALKIEAIPSPGLLRLTVADEGRGLGAHAPAAAGLGMTILDAIAKQLRASMTAESRGGARFTFVIPLAAEPRSFAAW